MARTQKRTRPRRARRRRVVVAIDGPAGAGKSTVARGTAKALGFRHLDTGSMYRAVTAQVLSRGIDPGDGQAAAKVARGMRFGFSHRGITAGGRALGKAVRTRAVGAEVSAVSAHPEVRKVLVAVQRRILRRGDVVAEGRDIGTVVFPGADIKIFLTASIAERARRRLHEMHRAGDPVSLARLRKEIARRDAADSTRPVSPLRPADDALVLDTTHKTARQAVREIVGLVREGEGDPTSIRANGSRRARTAKTRVSKGKS